MNDLSVVVKDILESDDLQNINKVDLKNISKEALIGVFKCVPVVGGVIASYLQIAKNNRETYLEMDFYRKLLAFIYGIKDLQPKDIKSFMDDVEENAKDFSGSVITNLISKTDNINKATVLANLIKSRVNNDITIHDFFRLSSMLERIPYIDLNELEKYQKAYYDKSGDTELLYATGALKLDTIDAQDENLYILSELGQKLLKYGLLRNTHVENQGGTSVNGMIMDDNYVSNANIDSMINSMNDDQAMFEFDRYRGK